MTVGHRQYNWSRRAARCRCGGDRARNSRCQAAQMESFGFRPLLLRTLLSWSAHQLPRTLCFGLLAPVGSARSPRIGILTYRSYEWVLFLFRFLSTKQHSPVTSQTPLILPTICRRAWKKKRKFGSSSTGNGRTLRLDKIPIDRELARFVISSVRFGSTRLISILS